MKLALAGLGVLVGTERRQVVKARAVSTPGRPEQRCPARAVIYLQHFKAGQDSRTQCIVLQQ